MPPRRYALGAMREIDNELRKARRRKRRPRNASSDCSRRRPRCAANPCRASISAVSRAQDIRDYLAKHPESLAVEIAEALGVPRDERRDAPQQRQEGWGIPKSTASRWSLTQHQGGQAATQGDL